MRLRFELFPDDLDATVDFYVDVLAFELVEDRRGTDDPYAALRRGEVRIGLARRPAVEDPGARRPPTGVELVLEVEDLEAERDRVVAAGWPIEEDVRSQPWGARDFRILDPSGYYLRLSTS